MQGESSRRTACTLLSIDDIVSVHLLQHLPEMSDSEIEFQDLRETFFISGGLPAPGQLVQDFVFSLLLQDPVDYILYFQKGTQQLFPDLPVLF